MKNLVLKYAMTAVCYLAIMTFANSLRASDLAGQNNNLSPIEEMSAKLAVQEIQIEHLEGELEGVKSQLSIALKENQELNQELTGMTAIKENIRLVEDMYLGAKRRALQADRELEVAKMNTSPYLQMEIADLRKQAARDAKTIADLEAKIEKLQLKQSLKRL